MALDTSTITRPETSFQWPSEETVEIKKFPFLIFPFLSSTEIIGEIERLYPTALSDQVETVLEYLEENNCEIRNRFEIRKFLLTQPHIIQYLWKAIEKIFEYFEKNQKTALELVFDPEIEKDEGELFFNIITNLEPEEALSRLDEIDEKWFLLDVIQKVSNFNLNLEFI